MSRSQVSFCRIIQHAAKEGYRKRSTQQHENQKECSLKHVESLMQIKTTLPHSDKMAPYCSTDRQMLVHKSLNAQDPQHLCEAAQPTPITLGRLSESGQRRWFQKQLCFNPLCPAARTTTQKRLVTLTCGNEKRLMSQIHWASQQATSTMQPRCTGMEDGQSPVGRVMPAVGSRGRQVWLHGLALLPQQ